MNTIEGLQNRKDKSRGGPCIPNSTRFRGKTYIDESSETVRRGGMHILQFMPRYAVGELNTTVAFTIRANWIDTQELKYNLIRLRYDAAKSGGSNESVWPVEKKQWDKETRKK